MNSGDLRLASFQAHVSSVGWSRMDEAIERLSAEMARVAGPFLAAAGVTGDDPWGEPAHR
jgi:hypothetical protein